MEHFNLHTITILGKLFCCCLCTSVSMLCCMVFIQFNFCVWMLSKLKFFCEFSFFDCCLFYWLNHSCASCSIFSLALSDMRIFRVFISLTPTLCWYYKNIIESKFQQFQQLETLHDIKENFVPTRIFDFWGNPWFSPWMQFESHHRCFFYCSS